MTADIAKLIQEALDEYDRKQKEAKSTLDEAIERAFARLTDFEETQRYVRDPRD